MEGVHNGLHNGKPDAVAPVLPGVGLVHLVKLLPDVGHILLRNGGACVEHGHLHLVPGGDDLHIHYPVSVQMVKRVAHIVSHNLLRLELIRPHIDRIFLPELDLGLLLLGHDLHALEHATDQFRQIKPLELHIFISEFKLVQSHEVFHHLVHLGGLIHDHVTVEFPALRIIADSFLQPFCVALNEGDRRLQLMGYIPHEVGTHLLHLFFLLNILLQAEVGILQL